MKKYATLLALFALAGCVSIGIGGCSPKLVGHQHLITDTAIGPNGFTASAPAIVSNDEFQTWAQNDINRQMQEAYNRAAHPAPAPEVSPLTLCSLSATAFQAELMARLDALSSRMTALEAAQGELSGAMTGNAAE